MTHNQLPQFRAMSTNVCPNARSRAMTDLTTCDQWSLTTWGYCHECWTENRVPRHWDNAVRAEMTRLTR